MENDLQKRIDETLEGNNYIKPVTPRPFLHTRVIARMEEKSGQVISLVPVPVKIACSLVLAVNIVFFSLSPGQSNTNSSEQLASFYQINSSDY